VRLPVAVGVKVTVTAQPPFAATDEPQLFVWAKSPVVEMEDMDAAELVGLDTDTGCAALVEPVTTEPKFSWLGLTCTVVPGYGGKTGVGLVVVQAVGKIPELPPLSVILKFPPSQL
jgi:hypothetical protein